MKIQDTGIKLSGLHKSDAEFLKSVTGREIKALVIRGGDPGQVALLRISDRTISASVENNSLIKGSKLFLQVNYTDGKFVLRLLGMEVPYTKGSIVKQNSGKSLVNLPDNRAVNHILIDPENQSALASFFGINSKESRISAGATVIERLKKSFSGKKESINSQNADLSITDLLNEKQTELINQLQDLYYYDESDVGSYIKNINEKLEKNSDSKNVKDNIIESSPVRIHSRLVRFDLEKLGRAAVLFVSDNPEFKQIRILILGSDLLKNTVNENRTEWTALLKKWNIDISQLECISVYSDSPEILKSTDGISERSSLDITF
jgi:hypothetical protein